MKFALQSALAASLLSPPPILAQEAQPDNIWRNPQNSVQMRIEPCGKGRCGVVVWANEEAKEDSARGGTPNLVGMKLFHGPNQVKSNVWKGTVFVPDINHTFTGTLTMKDQDTAVARGCILIICKSQTWTRVR